MADGERRIAALVRPLGVPTVEIAGIDAAAGLENLANRAAAFLGLAESAAELVDIQGCAGQWCQP